MGKVAIFCLFALNVAPLLAELHGGNTPFWENRDVSGFNTVEVQGPHALTISTGSKEELVIKSSNPKFINNTETIVRDGTLYIRFIDASMLFTGILEIVLISKPLSALHASVSAQINALSPFEAVDFNVVLSDAAGITGTIKVSYSTLSNTRILFCYQRQTQLQSD